MRVKLKPLAEQAIVITGASSGVGLATARLAARGGAKVLLVARNREALQRAVQEIQAQGGEADYAVADVGEASEVEAAATKAIERFGRIDTWINNAATSIFAQPTETPNDAHEKLFRTNYFGMVNGCLAALPYLRLQGGALISVGSVLSDMPSGIMAAYTASKHAVKAFVEGLRIQLAGEAAPVSVTLIKPSGIDTPFGQHAYNPGAGQAVVPGFLLYDPDVVARAILFCAAHPRRTLTVGGLGKLATLIAGHFPGLVELAEPMFGHRFFDYRKQQEDSSLFAPRLGGQVRSGTHRPRQTSLYTAAMMHPVASFGTAALLGLAGAYLFGRRRRR